MKLLRNILIVVVGLVLVLSLIGFLLPRQSHVERSREITASPTTVFMLLNSPKVFNEWSPWAKMDTTMTINYFGPESGVGAGYTWNSVDGDLGTGTWTIIGSDFLKQVNISLQFGEMDAALSKQIIEPTANGTKVTWTLDSDLGMNPLSRWFGLLMKGMIETDFENGLASFDSLARVRSTGRIEKIEIVTIPAQFALTIRETLDPSQLTQALARNYGAIITYAVDNQIEVSGPPFAIYHQWSKESSDTEAGLPTATLAPGAGPVKGVTLPAGQIVRAVYHGPYEGTEAAHAKVYAYIQQQKLTITGSPWEIYLSDPGTEPDPSKWLTYICYPVSTSPIP